MNCRGKYGDWCESCSWQNRHGWKLQAPNPGYDPHRHTATGPAVHVRTLFNAMITLDQAHKIAEQHRQLDGLNWYPTPL